MSRGVKGLKKIINRFFSTFALVSRIRVRRCFTPDYRYLAFFLPVVGLIVVVIILACYAFVWELLREPFLSAVAVMIIQYLLFNIFHFDGLLDSADALFCYADRDRRLEILKDVKIGAYALFAGTMYLVIKVYLLFRNIEALHHPDACATTLWLNAVLLFTYPISGRAAASLIPCFLSPARKEGLGVKMKNSTVLHSVLGTILSLSPVFIVLTVAGVVRKDWSLFWGLLVYISIVVGLLAAYLPYSRKIGGYTGDTQGFAVEMGEVVHLFLFYIIMITK